MDAMQFEQQVKDDPQLYTFVQEMAGDVAKQTALEEPQRFVTVSGADLLFGLVAYALFRWLKDYFDNRRALNEAEIIKQQALVIEALIEAGFPPKDARTAVITLLKNVSSRAAADPVLKKALALLGKAT